jgi:uncharacterized protein YoxC
MATNPTTEDIIEKRDTSPLATSCLALALVLIIGAITLQVMEISEIRADWSAIEKREGKIRRVESDVKGFEDDVSAILDKTAPIDADVKKNKDIINRAKAATDVQEEGDESAELAEDAAANGDSAMPAEDSSEGDDTSAPAEESSSEEPSGDEDSSS